MAIDAHVILYQFSAQDQLSPVAKQVVAELQAVEAATGKADAELQRLGLSSIGNIQTLNQTLDQQAQVQSQATAALDQGAVATQRAANADEELVLTRRQLLEATSDAVDGNTRFMAGLGELGLAAAVGFQAVNQLTEGIQAYIEAGAGAEKATAAMDAEFAANSQYAARQVEIIEAAATSFAKYGLTVTQVEDISSKMSPVISDAATQLRAIKDAADLAAAAHIDVSQAATLVQRAFEQGGSALHRYGVYIDDTARGYDVLTAIEQKFGGVADQVANTGAGAADHLAASQANLNETVGKDFTDAASAHNRAVADLLDTYQAGAEKGNKFADAAGFLSQQLGVWP